MWKEFHENWESLAFESERLLQQMTGPAVEAREQTDEFPDGKTREALVRTRVNQGFFRTAVLAAYGARCCITGLSVRELLSASHIVPWSVDVKNRTNPRNGMCLNAIHDRAFDCGLLTISLDFKVKLSDKLKRHHTDMAARQLLAKYDGISISLPKHFPPSIEFLRYHNQEVFIG